MFTFNNIVIAFFAVGIAGVLFIVFLLSKQHNQVNKLMKLNKGVTPLLLQKATQHKFNVIRTKLLHVQNVRHEEIKLHLDELAAKFRNQDICINTYNQGLDALLDQLNKNN